MLSPVAGTMRDRWLVWERFRPQFLEALEHCCGSHNEDDVMLRIASGTYQIWDGGTVATVTNWIEQPRYKAINIFLAAGDAEKVFELAAQAEKWAVANGATRLIWGGRPGWLRKVEGAQSMGLLMYKDI
jgi:hypothetical protein